MVSSFDSFGLVKSYEMPCVIESASMEPKYGNKFIAGGEDMWVHVFDFHTGVEIGESFIILFDFSSVFRILFSHNYQFPQPRPPLFDPLRPPFPICTCNIRAFLLPFDALIFFNVITSI